MKINAQKSHDLIIGVIFGGRSVEHEVSIITAHQVMDALDTSGFRVLPIYITKNGEWYAGNPLYNIKLYKNTSLNLESQKDVYRVSISPDRTVRQLIHHPNDTSRWSFKKPPHMWADVFFPAIHGTFGEDGTIQGLLDLADVPYVGSGTVASAIGMDKVKAKSLFRDAGIPVLDCIAISRDEYEDSPTDFIQKAEGFSRYPLIVKPISLGSSIGVSRCADSRELEEAVELAFKIDNGVLVEKALTEFVEINCSVIGPPGHPSVCEQPCNDSNLLTFEAKYKRGGKQSKMSGNTEGMASLERIIPAPLPHEMTTRVQELSVKAFKVINASGVARIDFLLETPTNNLYLNEINTMPGSIAFYLWEASDLSFNDLVANLVNLALEKHRSRRRTRFSFETNLLNP
ncbi:MAG: D-alanine--D-alanine ligase [Gammaproteobacteria bacterium]|nr:D-alanine--D-alanine ligase [Gammaproteobacteria bacterium]